MEKSQKPPQKRGPKPNHLQLDDENWGNAVKKAIQKKKPKVGWPQKGKKNRKS